MEGQNVLEKHLLVQDKKKEKEEKKKKEDMRKNNNQKLSFDAETVLFASSSGKCDAFGLHYCSECKSVLKSDCTKTACKMAG